MKRMELLVKFHHTQPCARLYRPDRLAQLGCDFAMAKAGVVGKLDHLSLLRSKRLECREYELPALPGSNHRRPLDAIPGYTHRVTPLRPPGELPARATQDQKPANSWCHKEPLEPTRLRGRLFQ